MANTYTLIASSVVGSGGASTIDFTSIPSTYTDLLIFASVRDNAAQINEDLLLRFNGSSSSYTNKNLYGSGSATGSNSPFTDKIYGGAIPGANSTASSFSNNVIYIPNYAGSSYKSVSVDAVQENNATTAYMNLLAGLWSNTAAITSISLFPTPSANFVQYSTAYLYGIKNS